MKIEYGPVYSRFIPESKEEDQAFKRCLTFFDSASIYSPKYRAGVWDGCVRFWSEDKFCTGLLQYAETTLGYSFSVTGRPTPINYTLTSDMLAVSRFEGKWAYQLDAIRTSLEARNGILWLATGAGKTVIAAAMTLALGVPTLFLVESIDLMRQTCDVFKRELKCPIGMLGGGYDDLQPITIAVTKSCMLKLKEKSHPFGRYITEQVRLVFADECHTASNHTYSTILSKCKNADYRYGLSGTPLDKSEIQNIRLIAFTGPVVARVSNEQLIELGVNAAPIVHIHSVGGPQSVVGYAEAYEAHIVWNKERNQQIVHIIREAMSHDKIVLVLVKHIAHGKILQQMLDEIGLEAEFCFGGTNKEERYDSLNAMRHREGKILILSKIGEVGIDIPALDVVIRASSGKSTVSTLQAIGRGLRAKTGRPNVVEYHDFLDKTNEYLLRHSKKRIADYKREGFEIRYV